MKCNEQATVGEAPENVIGRLITSQEEDRGHLARELHDDICQRLALLTFRIDKATKSWRNGLMSVGDQLEQIRQQCFDLGRHVQGLSHGLHPPVLDYLGLVPAAKTFCSDFSQETGTHVEFTDRNVPDYLSPEVSLGLFRVIQEGLHNSVKHSGEKRVEVHLRGRPSEIELVVSDRGVGFDVADVKNAAGLGLISMRERIQLLNGTISIESKPNAGTRICASVPLTSASSYISA
jgi:signal transduction histidine kinase